MKLRVTEKLFHCLLNSGLERYGDSVEDGTKRKLFETTITEVIRTKVLGNEECGRASQFTFNWSKGGRSVEKSSFTGPTCDKILMRLKVLATAIFDLSMDEHKEDEDETLKARQENYNILSSWLTIADNLVPMWELIEQHIDFTENQLLKLHKRCNTFMCQWVDLYGHTHITNYIHIIGSGHLPYFAKQYGNLYRFSQQGWEALNQMIKHYYFNNTNHGGALGNGGKNQEGKFGNKIISGDHCLPLTRLCQRALMWKLGLGDAYFLNKENENTHTIQIEAAQEEPANDGIEYNEVFATPEGHMFGYL
jgi:hypothetical protein